MHLSSATDTLPVRTIRRGWLDRCNYHVLSGEEIHGSSGAKFSNAIFGHTVSAFSSQNGVDNYHFVFQFWL